MINSILSKTQQAVSFPAEASPSWSLLKKSSRSAFLLFLFVLVTAGLSTAFAQDPAQYGTPFAGVPNTRDITMYQVNIRAYSPESNLAGVTERLDHIKDLGSNVVYLMPIFPVGTDARSKIASSTSPYSIKDFTSVGEEYGTLADLRALVDGAHSRGMAVILDWVANQTSWDHPWITEHPEWYVRDAEGVIQQLGSYADVAALDMNNAEMRAEMIKAMRYWVFAANIDGFRFDFANSAPLDFWQQTINNLRGIDSHKLILFAEGDRPEHFTVGFDLNFGFNFYYNALLPIQHGSPVSAIQTATDYEYRYANSNQQIVRYTGTHDTSGEGTPLEEFGGTEGVMANFVVAAYMRGVPFIYGGQEVAFASRIPFPWDGVDIAWDQNPEVTEEFKRVISFRNSSTAIRRGELANYSDLNVSAFTKIAGTEKVLVLSNLRSAPSEYIIPAALAGTYTDAYTGAEVTIVSGATLVMDGYEYMTLTSRHIPAHTRISVSPLNSSIAKGTTLQLTATLAPADAKNQPIHWSTSDASIATVDQTGLVNALAPGTVTITATTHGKKTATAAVTVLPPNNFTVHFYKPSNWATGINLYYWAAEPAGTLPGVSWPGVPMTDEGDGWYSYSFTNVSYTNLIFNDGANQTANLSRTKEGWFLNDTWYDTKPEIGVSAGNYYHIKNRWQGNAYLYDDESGVVRYGAAPETAHYQWETVDAGDGFYLLKNRATGRLMHVQDQNGTVQATDLPPSWWSAMWSLPVTEDGWYYIQNRWQPSQLVNIEGLAGHAQYSGANMGWWSAMWQFEKVAAAGTSASARMAASATEAEATPAFQVQLFPNPAKGHAFTVALSGAPAQEQASLLIHDVHGKVVLKTKIMHSASIEHKLRPGLYFVRISAGGVEETRKLIIE